MRMALARTVGGFDEACTEFIRIPGKCEAKHVPAMLKGAALIRYKAAVWWRGTAWVTWAIGAAHSRHAAATLFLVN